MKPFVLLVLSFLLTSLTSCAITRDYVDIEYKPSSAPQAIEGAENIDVAVNVIDVRVKENIGCKINGYGMEMANIMTNNDLTEVFKNAIIWELEQRGFVIAQGGSNLNIELCKFFNDYKLAFCSARANSETVLNVSLRNKHGKIVYSKTIFGFGEEETCYLATGNNAALALEKSLRHAVQRLINDPDFICTLLQTNDS